MTAGGWQAAAGFLIINDLLMDVSIEQFLTAPFDVSSFYNSNFGIADLEIDSPAADIVLSSTKNRRLGIVS